MYHFLVSLLKRFLLALKNAGRLRIHRVHNIKHISPIRDRKVRREEGTDRQRDVCDGILDHCPPNQEPLDCWTVAVMILSLFLLGHSEGGQRLTRDSSERLRKGYSCSLSTNRRNTRGRLDRRARARFGPSIRVRSHPKRTFQFGWILLHEAGRRKSARVWLKNRIHVLDAPYGRRSASCVACG